ncbi:MAG: hypothetical protein K2W78_10375 [Xanthobacteraceae bacterium]|nr:hypothetical protein [Xanthobacteraceae bacterium]
MSYSKIFYSSGRVGQPTGLYSLVAHQATLPLCLGHPVTIPRATPGLPPPAIKATPFWGGLRPAYDDHPCSLPQG